MSLHSVPLNLTLLQLEWVDMDYVYDGFPVSWRQKVAKILDE